MSATEFGLSLLYIAVAVIWYAAGWWQGRTLERDRWQERAAGQDQLVQRDQQGQRPEVLVGRQPFEPTTGTAVRGQFTRHQLPETQIVAGRSSRRPSK